MRTRIQAAKGFTLVELIIVVIIIGILAAIAVAGFNAYTKQAAEKQVVSDLKNASLAAEGYQNSTGANGYAGIATGTALADNGLKLTEGVTMSAAGTADAYCFEGSNAKGGTWRLASTKGAPEQGTCATAGVAGLPAVAAVTVPGHTGGSTPAPAPSTPAPSASTPAPAPSTPAPSTPAPSEPAPVTGDVAGVVMYSDGATPVPGASFTGSAAAGYDFTVPAIEGAKMNLDIQNNAGGWFSTPAAVVGSSGTISAHIPAGKFAAGDQLILMAQQWVDMGDGMGESPMPGDFLVVTLDR